MTRVIVSSLALMPEVARLHRPSHLVSLIDPGTPVLRPDCVTGTCHLTIEIHDITGPRPGATPPGLAHVETLVRWLDRWPREDPILIHCFAGVSRSTAAALIALAHHEGPGREADAARRLRRASRTASPNRRLIALADDVLGRDGRLIEAVEAMGESDFLAEARPFHVDLARAEGEG
ncbi:MAG: protein tyrosine phosphatase [Alphaproteobacteria bacterium]|nr:protein tyrosine phosphatase [Alphaproteobacteria bacterium]